MSRSNLAQDKSLGQHWLIDELVLDNIALSLSEVMGRIFRYDDFAALGESYGQKRNGNADDAD